MSFITILMTAIGLAMDAFAVSLTIGINADDKDKMKASLMAGVYFGIFQAAMPIIGWLLGVRFTDYIQSIDHWIAFVLLFIIGANMIKESMSKDEEEVPENILSHKKFVILAIATSIDALAVGVSFAFLKVNIFYAACTIGIVTFVLSFIAVLIGKKIGEVLKSKSELLGGAILIFIGFKILIEHLTGK